MKLLSKKTIAAMVAGTFMIAAAATPFIVQAAEINPSPTEQHQMQQNGPHEHKINPEKIAQHLANAFGIDQATILQYHSQGMNFKDIGRAAFLANASGKDLADVINLKTADNNWKDVASALGITKEQMKAARQTMIATGLNKKTGLDKDTALTLLQQGYHPRDIGMAAQIEKNTSKPLIEVLAMKKINNTWFDVATTLGVDQDTFRKDMTELGSHHRGHRGHHCHDNHPVQQ